MPTKTRGLALGFIRVRLTPENSVLAGIGALLFFCGFAAQNPAARILFFLSAAAILIHALHEMFSKKNAVIDASERTNQFIESFTLLTPESPMTVESESQNRMEEDEPLVRHDEPAPRMLQREFTVADFLDSVPIPMGDPKLEFHALLEKILGAVHSTFFAHSVVFFWIKHDLQQMIIESKATASGTFTSEKKITLGTDLISRIGATGRPELVSDIAPNTERDALPYYSSIQNIRSFVGVPVYFPDGTSKPALIGIIAVDSKAKDAFGQESVVVLGSFTKALSVLLKSWSEKFDLLEERRLLAAARRIQLKIAPDALPATIVNTLAEELSPLIAWDAMAIVLFDDPQKQWVIANARTRGNNRYASSKQVVDFHNSLAGETIRTNKARIINDLSAVSERRFFAAEQEAGIPQSGSLLFAPVSTQSKCYGALAVECRDKNIFTKKDIENLQYLTTASALAFELRESHALVAECAALDDTTETFSRRFLLRRLSEEILRSEVTGNDLSFVQAAVTGFDDVVRRFGKQAGTMALERVAAILKNNTRAYDVIGRYNDTTFGVVLIDTIANDAFLWAEKIRAAIASSVIAIEEKSFSVSVTISIAGIPEGMTAEKCLQSSDILLQRALEAGGNMVRVV